MSDGPKELRPHGHVYGNFKPTRTERERVKKTHKSAQQRREGNDEKYLAAIRQCPCIGCLTVHVRREAHHLRNGPAKVERAFGRRSTDRFAVPLCVEDHFVADRAGEKGKEDSLFKAWGIEHIYDLADALFMAPRDPEIMTRIILAHKDVKK